MCRAIIQICSSDENFYIYRSKDGYPECCGLEFLAVTKKYESNCNANKSQLIWLIFLIVKPLRANAAMNRTSMFWIVKQG